MKAQTVFTSLTSVLMIYIISGMNVNGQALSVADLTAQNAQTRMTAYRKIMSEYEELGASLINVVKTESSDNFSGGKSLAIQLLGELRTERAVDVLLQNLMFCPIDRPVEESIPTQGYYIAAVALVKIGTPAVQRVFSRMRKTEDENEAMICAWIIKEIIGPEEVVRSIEKIKTDPDIQIQARASRMENYIKTFKPTFERPMNVK